MFCFPRVQSVRSTHQNLQLPLSSPLLVDHLLRLSGSSFRRPELALLPLSARLLNVNGGHNYQNKGHLPPKGARRALHCPLPSAGTFSQ